LYCAVVPALISGTSGGDGDPLFCFAFVIHCLIPYYTGVPCMYHNSCGFHPSPAI
jgi:hypothetical protein